MPLTARLRLRPPVSRLVQPPTAVPARPRARRSVAWGLVAFAGVQLALGLTAEAYPRLRDPLYGDKFANLARRVGATRETRPLVVMLGSSRTGLAFHGRRAEEVLGGELGRPAVAFNFGIPASGPVTHLVYLKRMLRAGVVPDVLVVEVLPAMIHADPNGPRERLWFYADRITFGERGMLTGHGFDPGEVRDRYARSVLLPAYTLRFQMMCRIVPSWLPWQVRFDWSRGADEYGWGKFEHQTVTAERREQGLAQARAEYAAVLAGLEPGGGAADALRELLAVCRANGIRARLVLMPEGTPFRGWYGRGANDRLLAFLRELAAEADAPLIDARDWLPDDAFTDGHHMLEAGAVAFTERLAREALAPAVKSRGN